MRGAPTAATTAMMAAKPTVRSSKRFVKNCMYVLP